MERTLDEELDSPGVLPLASQVTLSKLWDFTVHKILICEMMRFI